MRRKLVYIDNFLSGFGATPTTGVTLANLFEAKGLTVVRAGTKKNKLARLAQMLGSIIAQPGAVFLLAVYSTSAFYFAWSCAMLCRMLGRTFIPCLHGGNLPARIKNNPRLSKQLFGHSYTNVVVSGYLQQSLVENGWKNTLIPNSIKLNRYPFLQRNNVKPALFWVRSFHEIYNPVLAIDIVKDLCGKYPGVTLTMVGPDKDGSLAVCQQRAEQLHIESKITYTGRLTVDEWTALSAQHDIFINTTNFDNLPVSVIEAMALGMPVVTTNAGGLKYLVNHGVNGLLVNTGDKAAFVQCIDELLEGKIAAGKLSLHARDTASVFDEAAVWQQWHNLFSQLQMF